MINKILKLLTLILICLCSTNTLFALNKIELQPDTKVADSLDEPSIDLHQETIVKNLLLASDMFSDTRNITNVKENLKKSYGHCQGLSVL